MIVVKQIVPIEMVNDNDLDVYLWRTMALEIKNNIGLEEPYVFTFKRYITPDKFTPNVNVFLECDIKAVKHDNYSVQSCSDIKPFNTKLKAKRIDRLIQFIKGD